MEGYRDPFNRCGFPWGKEDNDLVEWYKDLGQMRGSISAFCDGEFRPVYAEGNVISYLRYDNKSGIYCAFNSGDVDVIMDIPFSAWIQKLLRTELLYLLRAVHLFQCKSI